MRKSFYITRTNDVPLSFEGEVIASASTNTSKNHNKKQRWTELYMYKTVSGKFVSESIGVSIIPNEMNIVKAEVFDNITEALQFFRNRDGQFTWASNQILKAIQEKFPESSFDFGICV